MAPAHHPLSLFPVAAGAPRPHHVHHAMPAFLPPPPLTKLRQHSFLRRARRARAPALASSPSLRPSMRTRPNEARPNDSPPSSSSPNNAATPGTTNWPDLSARAQATLSHLRTRPPSQFGSLLRRHVLQDASNPFLWHALAKHLLSSERSPTAAASVLAEAVRRVPPGRRGGLYELWGALELRRGAPETALRIFADGIVADPYAPLFVSLGSAQTRAGLPDAARETFRKGALAFPNHAALWRAWAFLESRHGAPSVARDKWRVAVERDRFNARAWEMLVQFEEKCGSTPSDCAEMLYEALASCPADSHLRLHLARIEEKRKGTGVARAVLTPVAAQNDERVLRALARLEAEQGNYDRARGYFRRAADVEDVQSFKSTDLPRKHARSKRRLKQDERTVKSLHAWALMEARIGNSVAARKVLDEARSISQTDSGIWRAIGELESREKNFEQARKAFQNAVAIDPQDPRLLLAWGKTEVLAGDLSRAEILIDRVAKTESTLTTASSAPLLDSDFDVIESPDNAIGESERQKAFEVKRSAVLTPHILAEALRERAMLASRNGQFDDSVNLLTRASQVEPSSPAGWRLLAQQELRLRGIESTRKVYQTGIERVDQSAKPKLLHWWGQDERASGNGDEARALFRQATCANPDYMSAWISWGLMEKSEGSVDEACTIFEQASKRAERDVLRAPFIFQAWGRVEELDRGRPDIAAEVFQRGVNLSPKSGALWSAWGLLEERRGNVERAREYFSKATNSDPKYGSAWHSWALLELRRCNYEKAAELFRLGNENDPTNSSLLASWAMMEGKQLSNIVRSRDLFERAVTADPYFSPAWHSWGCLEMKAGSLEKARQLFEKAAEVRTDDPSPWHTLGVLEAEHCDDPAAAISSWKRAIQVTPGHALSYQSWALLEARVNNDMEEARRLFQEGIGHEKQKQTGVALLLQSWGWLEEQAGNTEEARKLLRKSLDADRRRAETWHALAIVEKCRGNREGARRLLKDAVEIVSPSSTAAPLYVVWATLEAEEGDIERARELFSAGIRSNPSHSATWNAYAAIENKYGSKSRAAEITLSSGALFVRNEDANEEFLV